MGHGLAHRFEPLTVCSYEVDVEDIVDLRDDDSRKGNGVTLAELDCAWAADIASKREPPSWRLAKRMIANDRAGILVPSFAIGARGDMSNLVLWKWGPHPPHHIESTIPVDAYPRIRLHGPVRERGCHGRRPQAR